MTNQTAPRDPLTKALHQTNTSRKYQRPLRPYRIKNLAGMQFGRLTVISLLGIWRGKVHWKCECECGKIVEAASYHLQRGNTKSCGCYGIETRQKNATTHGMSDTWLYSTWRNIRDRCLSENIPAYANYGARGISLHRAWMDFVPFKQYIDENIGPRPSEKHSLDRIDNDGNYEPGNLRWATRRQQANNTRNNKFITYRGETLTVAQWARRLQISYDILRHRLNNGWSVERAIEQPILPVGKHKRRERKSPNGNTKN